MVRERLKEQTRDFHRALEARLGVLLRDDISIPQYAAVQKKFYGFYKPVEARLFAIRSRMDAELALENRRKVPLLTHDLTALAVTPDQMASLPVCERLPNLNTVADALGCLYVLEGSTLGGQIITRHLKRALPFDEVRGCSFFHCYGDDTGGMWMAFLGILERHCERSQDAEAVVRSACRTFASLDRWFWKAA